MFVVSCGVNPCITNQTTSMQFAARWCRFAKGIMRMSASCSLGAENVAGWGRHVRPYAWAALGAAAATAFWIISKRERKPPAAEAAPSAIPHVHQEIAQATGQDLAGPNPHQRLWHEACNLAISVAVRAAQNYAAHSIEQWITQQRITAATRHAPSASAAGMERPNGRILRPEQESIASQRSRSNLVTEGSNDVGKRRCRTRLER